MVVMNAERFFTDEEKERIRQAVISAERKTSGEIVPMLVQANRQSIAGKLHTESDPVRKSGAGAARVGYQRTTGNHSPVTVS